jgi:sec-independent protein translocase protein TatA
MGEIGFDKLLLIAVVVLLLFGAKRVPEIGASLGKGIREFKRSLSDTQDAVSGSSVDRPTRSSEPDKTSPDAASGEPRRLSR